VELLPNGWSGPLESSARARGPRRPQKGPILLPASHRSNSAWPRHGPSAGRTAETIPEIDQLLGGRPHRLSCRFSAGLLDKVVREVAEAAKSGLALDPLSGSNGRQIGIASVTCEILDDRRRSRGLHASQVSETFMQWRANESFDVVVGRLIVDCRSTVSSPSRSRPWPVRAAHDASLRRRQRHRRRQERPPVKCRSSRINDGSSFLAHARTSRCWA